MKRATMLALSLAAALAGCDHNEYEIIITPWGKGIHRKITAARLDRTKGEGGKETVNYKALPAKELQILAKAYRTAIPEDKQDRYTFESAFESATPDDVGGSGSYTAFVSTLGSVRAYSERFRGDDDQAGQIQKAFGDVDILVDVIVGWLKTELGKEKDFDKLARLLDRDVRRDLKNLRLMLWMGINVPRLLSAHEEKAKEPIQMAVALRASQYLVERNYFRYDQAPGLLRLFTEQTGGKKELADSPEAQDKDDAKRHAELRRNLKAVIGPILTAKAGVTNPKLLDRFVDILTDTDTMKESFLTHYAATDHFKKAKADWKAKADKAPEGERPKEPTPEDWIGKLFESAVLGGLIDFGTDDLVTVRFNDPQEPVLTNGQWDKAKGQVVWQGHLHARPEDGREYVRLPVHCFAAWTLPDTAEQKRRFGKVILTEKELAGYCVWRASLNPAEAAKWDAFLASLKPGKDLVGKLDAFRFREAKAGADAKDEADYARKGTELLIGKLGGKAKEQ